MKKWTCLFVLLTLAFSELALANRFADAWEVSHGHFRRHFYPERREGEIHPLFLLSSTSISTASVTTFTSGGTLQPGAAMRQQFIDENLYALQLDSAKGEGEYLHTLAILSGCDQADSQAQLGAQIRSHYASVYDQSSDDPNLIAARIDQLIQADPQMKKSCHNQLAMWTP